MRRKIFGIVLIFSMIILYSCGAGNNKANKAVIIGKYNTSNEQVYINKVTAGKVKLLDSAALMQSGNFIFEVNAPDYTVFRIVQGELSPIMVIARNGDTVNITQLEDKAWPYKVKGSEQCMFLVDYLEKLNRDHYKVDSLAAIFRNSQGHPEFVQIRDQLNDEFVRIHQAHIAYAQNFVTRHPDAIASIIVINSFFKDFALFSPAEDFNFYEIVDEALMERFPENKHVLDFHQQVANIKEANDYEFEARMRLSSGRLVPDFELRSTSGQMVGPKDFSEKDRSLLIYFWAAADAKSRQINPRIKQVYEAYNLYGLDVLAVSFDKDPDLWQAAIKLDSIPGTHVTDLKGAGSPVQRLFNLKMRLPAYMLVDNTGVIFRHGNDFTNLLQDIKDMYDRPMR